MTQLEIQYNKFLEINPEAKITFDEWKENVLSQSDFIKEHRDALMEIQKMAQKLLEKEK